MSASPSAPVPDESPPVPDESPPVPDDSPPVPDGDSSPSGEIWQWALGRNVWTDPNLEPYARLLGTGDTDVNVASQGFKLGLDGVGTVVNVTVFNDENALGFPASETNFLAYPGALPLGLSWEDTADSVQDKYPDYTRSGGWGTDIVLTYFSAGYRVDVALLARHEDQLPGSPLHSIAVAAGPER